MADERENMNLYEPKIASPTAHASTIIKRISWAAIFAGMVVTLVVELVLSLLGIGIGASTIDPLQQQNPMSGIGLGAGIWFLIGTLLALFAGGWTAGRLAGIPRSLDSALHGVVTWGLATLFTFYLLTSTVGSLIGGATQLLGQGASLLGRGAAAAAPMVGNAIRGELKEQGIGWDDIQRQADLLLRQTGKAELNPNAIKGQTRQETRDAKNTAAAAARNPHDAGQDLNALLDRIFEKGSATIDAADRDAIINVLVARTNMSRTEASRTVDQWQEMYQKTRSKYEQAKEQAAQKAREVADATARNVSRAALWTFVALLIGLGAATWGGHLGTPRDALAPVRGEY